MVRTKISNLDQLRDGDKIMFSLPEWGTIRDAAAAVLANGRVYLCQDIAGNSRLRPALRHGYTQSLLVRDPTPNHDARPALASVLGLVRLEPADAVPTPVPTASAGPL
jgi:hypothetical protein